MTRDLTTEPITDSGTHPTKQGWQRVTTHRVIHVGATPDSDQVVGKLRVTVYRDAYDHQSRFTAETWTPTGWVEVVTIHPLHPSVTGDNAVPPAAAIRSSVAMTVERANRLTDRLVDQALAVLA